MIECRFPLHALCLCTTNCENSLAKKDFFLIEPRRENCSPGRSEAEAGVRHYLQISPAMRGARERGSYCLSPLSGLAQMGPVNPGFRFASPGATNLAPLRGSIRNLSFFDCSSVALCLIPFVFQTLPGVCGGALADGVFSQL